MVKINYIAQKCSAKTDPLTRLMMLAPQYDPEKMRAIAETNKELERGKPCTEVSSLSIASGASLKRE